MESLEFAQIGETERGLLERRFEKEEILSVVTELERDKWLLYGIFRVVKRDVLAVFEEFYQHYKYEKSLNDTFIALIPKKNYASNIQDFRPTSLVGSIYKILAKVLANRLKVVIDQLISKS